MKSMMIQRILAPCFLLACTQPPPVTDKPDSGDPVLSGQIVLRYAIEPDLVAKMDEPARGVFYGEIYDARQATGGTPDDGAQRLDYVEHSLDLGDGTIPTELLHTTVPLTVDEIVVIGFLDSDENAGEHGNAADGGDPLALGQDNTFEVVIDITTAVTIALNRLEPKR
jgi:hypothetical protein